MLKIALSLTLVFSSPLGAEEVDSDVYARAGDVELTQIQVDAAFADIDPSKRLVFIRNEPRVNNLIQGHMRNALLAEQAREAGFDQVPLTEARLQLALNKALADLWLEHRVETAPPADYEALAREYYLLNPQLFALPSTYDVTHLLISTRERTEDEARALATELLEKTRQDPGVFDDLVQEYSEDPSLARNNGSFTKIPPGQMVQPFEEAVNDMDTPGTFSDLVQTRYGFHIIRLDEKRPPTTLTFDQVKSQLIMEQTDKHKERLKANIILEATDLPLEIVEGAQESMLKRYFGENLEKAPDAR